MKKWLQVSRVLTKPVCIAGVLVSRPNFKDDLSDVFAAAVTLDRITALLAGVFGGATLLLATIGVGGLFAYTVVLRTKEIAIRLALGAEPWQIVKPIMREGLVIALMGTTVGAVVAAVSTRPVGALLFGIGPDDSVALVAAPVVLAAVTVCACVLPAARAARADPAVGLRLE